MLALTASWLACLIKLFYFPKNANDALEKLHDSFLPWFPSRQLPILFQTLILFKTKQGAKHCL